MQHISKSILSQFTSWFDEAEAHPAIRDHHAMTFATCDAAGRVSARIVLLKQYDARGFVFFTNYNGRKSRDILEHPQAALCLYWEPLGKQIRIEGRIGRTSEAESDMYFAERPRESQIGAWASNQSEILENRALLESRFQHYRKNFEGQPVPRPPHWGGWRVVPDRIEFWQNGDHRLHQRVLFSRQDDGVWVEQLLNP